MFSRPYLKLENFCRAFMNDVKNKKKEEKKPEVIEEVKTVRTLDVIILEKNAR